MQAWFNLAPVALIAVDRRTLRIRLSNALAAKLLGYQKDTLTGLRFPDVFEASDALRIDALFGGSDTRLEPALLNGCAVGEITVDLSVNFPGGDEVVVAVQDATARVAFEKQLMLVARMESVGMLAGGIAHDFNNLLTIIAGYTQMLQASPQLATARDKMALEQVLNATGRAAELTGQLLSFSRRRAPLLQGIYLATLIDQSALLLQRLLGSHIELRIYHEGAPQMIHADSTQLQQVLMNLVANARDAMPGGGQVMITTSSVTLEQNAARKLSVLPGAFVILAVRDTGVGISAEMCGRIFDAFFTTKEQGTGLGLATVAGIVRRYHGAVEVTSQPGAGATFQLYFPRWEASTPMPLTRTAGTTV